MAALLDPVTVEFDKTIMKFPSIPRFVGGASNDLMPNLQRPDNPVPLLKEQMQGLCLAALFKEAAYATAIFGKWRPAVCIFDIEALAVVNDAPRRGKPVTPPLHRQLRRRPSVAG